MLTDIPCLTCCCFVSSFAAQTAVVDTVLSFGIRTSKQIIPDATSYLLHCVVVALAVRVRSNTQMDVEIIVG